MPYMPPDAKAEALRRMQASPNAPDIDGGGGGPFVPPQVNQQPGGGPMPRPAASAPNGARTLPAPPPHRPQINPAGVFSDLTARLVGRGMRPADAARAAGLALRKRGIAFATRR